MIESEVKVIELNQNNLKNYLNALEKQNKAEVIEDLNMKKEKDLEEMTSLKLTLDEMNHKIQHLDSLTSEGRKIFDTLKTEFQAKRLNSKLKEEYEQGKSLCELLQRSYQGVYGRFKDLCHPTHKKYRVAFDRIISKYSNSFVVDSRKTVNLILKNERSKFENQIFLAVDMIKAPQIKKVLDDIDDLNGICLLYDVVECKNPVINNIVRFVVGNTIYCETQGQALNVAYRLNRR